MKKRSVLTAFFFLSLLSTSAFALERYALLIANQRYAHQIGELKFPEKDIAVLEKSLVKLGFKVTKVTNVGLREFNQAIREHTERVKSRPFDPAQIVQSFVYYAGHGAADADTKTNYLIPIDATDASTKKLWDGAINLKVNVLETLRQKAPDAHHYVVVDACRNELKLRDQTRALTIGHKTFVPPSPVSGMLIAYTTDENQTTPDDGEYAKALAKAILAENDDIVMVFRNVQLEIQAIAKRHPYAVAIGLPPVYWARNYSVEAAVAKPVQGPESLFDMPVASNNCPEITIMDYSTYPAVSRIERRCLPGKVN